MPSHPFRVVHTADWHLGHELAGHCRGAEHDHFLDWLCATLAQREADALVVAGDVYDSANPPVAAQQRLYRFLRRALDQRPTLQVVLVGGNHDGASRVELPGALLDPGRVHLVGSIPRGKDGRADHGAACIALRGRCGTPRAMCLAVPYLRSGDLPAEGGVGALYAEAAAAVAAAGALGGDERGPLPLLVTGHLTLHGGEVSTASERRIVVGGEESVPVTAFPAHAAYVALGHLHRPQAIRGGPPMRYAGSPFPLSATERDYEHSVVLLELDGATFQQELLPIPRLAPFLRVGPGPLDQVLDLLAALDLTPCEDARRPYLDIQVELTGPEPLLRRKVEDALDGRAVRLVGVQVRAAAGAAGDPGGNSAGAVLPHPAGLAELDPETVFARMHQQEYRAPPSDALLRAFRQLLSDVENADA